MATKHAGLPAATGEVKALIGGRYRLLTRLARGGSAEVWRAHDEELARDVAVKLPHAHLVAEADTRRRLVAEARAAAGLSHRGIVPIYDVVTDGDRPALVFELVRGESLASRLDREGTLAPTEVARIGAQVADALQHAHEHGVVHRDVNPGNVLIERDGRARLVDFGIARLLDEAAERLTVAGTVAGTLGYMAPEQLAGGEITPRSDLYALGAVLFRALTGRPPFDAASPVGLAEAQRRGPPAATELGVDPALAAIIVAALSFDPDDRPATAGVLAGALRDWVEGPPTVVISAVETAVRGDRATPNAAIAAGETVPAAAVAATPAASSRPAARPLLDRRTALTTGGLAVVAGLLALAALFLGTGPLDRAATETPPPPWLAALLADFGAACGPDAEAPNVEGLSEDQARDLFKEAIDACEEAADDGGNGKGKGRGKGGGNGGD